MEVPNRKTVSIMRAVEVVGVSRRTIYNWLKAGKLQYVRTAGGSIRIFEDTLWREANEFPNRDLDNFRRERDQNQPAR